MYVRQSASMLQHTATKSPEDCSRRLARNGAAAESPRRNRGLRKNKFRQRGVAAILQRFRVVQVSLYGSHHNAGIYGDQVKAHQLETNPGINHDAFVQYPIEYIEKAGAAGLTFDDHGAALMPRSEFLPVLPELAAKFFELNVGSPELGVG